MSKFTPEHWTTGGESDPLSILSAVSYVQVAAANEALPAADANARLIAAAPELYELVAAIVAERSKCYIPCADINDQTFKWDEKAAAVIAKAKGEQ